MFSKMLVHHENRSLSAGTVDNGWHVIAAVDGSVQRLYIDF